MISVAYLKGSLYFLKTVLVCKLVLCIQWWGSISYDHQHNRHRWFPSLWQALSWTFKCSILELKFIYFNHGKNTDLRTQDPHTQFSNTKWIFDKSRVIYLNLIWIIPKLSYQKLSILLKLKKNLNKILRNCTISSIHSWKKEGRKRQRRKENRKEGKKDRKTETWMNEIALQAST